MLLELSYTVLTDAKSTLARLAVGLITLQQNVEGIYDPRIDAATINLFFPESVWFLPNISVSIICLICFNITMSSSLIPFHCNDDPVFLLT